MKIKQLLEEQRELKEKLADIEHQRWSDWQEYLHSMLDYNLETDEYLLDSYSFQHWEHQIKTNYKDLTEKEKDSDRKQVDRYWDLIMNSQTQLIKAILDEMVGEEKVYLENPNEYSCAVKIYVDSYNKRIKEEKAKRDEILRELEL